MSTIDKFFCNTALDSIFPLATIQAFAKLGSDHTPLMWDSGFCIRYPDQLAINLKSGGC
jgi:hypothetical protein